ncbi:MAG: saccharopine dehydrogenase NADP-binding domain-containing protein [Bacteroidales bacterium]|nr:saccharopine dehydrogenase NADP-binding domain-containing protein [Bacteroidales bacterium]
MKQKIVVLGAGLVGKAIAIDLVKSGHEVTSMDLNGMVLNELKHDYGISTICTDFTGDHLKELVKEFDLVVGAAPGAYGYGIMERVIKAGKNMVDISFCPEDFMELDTLAREQGVTVVADMGVAPGMCNAILGYHNERMKVTSYRCLVGGLPFERPWPLEYKSSWSPMDCIEEYTRPARFRENGKNVIKPALSDLEPVDFEGIGTLEAWNSDGLRSLLDSFPDIPMMVEKTLRYPGTVEYLKVLRELGYFSTDEVNVRGHKVRPVDLTASLLFPLFKLEKGEREFTVMRVILEGEENGEEKTYVYDLYDEYDPETDTSSMARTTGYTCTGAVGLILNGLLTEKGLIPPEKSALKENSFQYLLEHLKNRHVIYHIKNNSK